MGQEYAQPAGAGAGAPFTPSVGMSRDSGASSGGSLNSKEAIVTELNRKGFGSHTGNSDRYNANVGGTNRDGASRANASHDGVNRGGSNRDGTNRDGLSRANANHDGANWNSSNRDGVNRGNGATASSDGPLNSLEAIVAELKQKGFGPNRSAADNDGAEHGMGDGAQYGTEYGTEHRARHGAEHDVRQGVEHDVRYGAEHGAQYGAEYDARQGAEYEAEYGATEPGAVAYGGEYGAQGGPVDGTGAQDDGSGPAGLQGPAGSGPDALASWSEEDKAMLAGLPPDLQQAVVRRETERERAVLSHARDAAVARQEYETINGWANTLLDANLRQSMSSFDADFSDIDWAALQNVSPSLYLHLDALHKRRLADMQGSAARFQELTAHGQMRHAERAVRHMANEVKNAEPVVSKLLGPSYDSRRFSDDLRGYLRATGAPDEHVNGMGYGYQLVMATKAMLYDRQETARQNAAGKVASAPRVQKASARQSSGSREAELREARAALDRDPNSKENLVRVLLAERS